MLIVNNSPFCEGLQLMIKSLLVFVKQDSSFSFYRCLPSGWEVLLLSYTATVISERVFLDKENFWHTLPIHLAIGLACFCFSSIVMYVIFSFMFIFGPQRILKSTI